ncbi:MAG: polymerase [Thermosediminibacterales bacterium]|nr:polymerase [Thermosediminibacterales bacterium]MDK2835472.1 polymerase [Thermosediminibacterales bacterium]
MKNLELSWMFSEIADLLEIKGENPFKIRTYRKAANVLMNLPIKIEKLYEEKKLMDIPGIGKALASKIQEYLETGKCEFYDKIKKEVSPDLRELLKIPGLGPKKIKIIIDNLDVKNIDDLEIAAKTKKLRELPGMGSKTEFNILRAIRMFREKQKTIPMGVGLPFAEAIVKILEKIDVVENVEITGSLRRRKDVISNIDILVGSTDPKTIIKVFERMPSVKQIDSKNLHHISVILDVGIRVELEIVEPRSFYTALHNTTGSQAYIKRLDKLALEQGLKIEKHGVFNSDGTEIEINKESDIYRALKIPYIIPELREDRGEIETALKNKLPQVINNEDILGDLHIHTNWSDGINSIEEVVEKAQEKGYKYVAVTDHSKSLGIAKGLSEKRLMEQKEIISKLNEKLNGFKILSGIEMDILRNNELDYSDEILEEMDLVIASIHTGFHQDRDKITRRLETAIKNDNVDIIAHPTGRLLGKRDAYDVDIDYLFDIAAKHNTVFEINSSPDRLDLNDVLAKKAKEHGIKLAINTDSHDVTRMDDIRFGIGIARRAWLEKTDVINCMEYKELMKFLRKKY